jgi:hypothetical protein
MLVFGKRLYGRVLRCGEAYVATWFFHVWFIPLIPLGSAVVLRHLEGDQIQTLPTGLNLRSAAMAYLRGWSVFLLLHGLVTWADPGAEFGPYYGPAASLLALVGIVVGFFVLGRTDADTKARLETYARVFGHPVDLALLLAPDADGLARFLREELIANGRQTAVNYRVTYDPATQWGDIALDPSMTDPRFITHALCLARIERGQAQGAARAALDTLHDRIWTKLRALEAAYTQRAAQPIATAP